jgi:hypothetical protein
MRLDRLALIVFTGTTTVPLLAACGGTYATGSGASKTAAPIVQPAQPAQPKASTVAAVTFAAKVTGSKAYIALAARGDKAIAYVCDGRRVESWLVGTTAGGLLSLTGPHGGRIVGTVDGGVASGSFRLSTGAWQFEAPVVRPPSGLYQASAIVRRAKVTAGWIVLPNGKQVGLLTRNGALAPAPRIDPASTEWVTLDGKRVKVEPAYEYEEAP